MCGGALGSILGSASPAIGFLEGRKQRKKAKAKAVAAQRAIEAEEAQVKKKAQIKATQRQAVQEVLGGKDDYSLN